MPPASTTPAPQPASSRDASRTAARRAPGTALGLAALAASGVLYATAPHGVSGWHFAVNNIAAAASLLAGQGLDTSRGEPFLSWPPLLPLLLAALKLAGLRFLQAAQLVTVAAMFAFVVFQARTLARLTRSALAAAACVLLHCLTPQFFDSAVSLRSQPLFMALAAGAAWSVMGYVDRPSRARLAAVVVLIALACLHRYDGLFLLAGAAGVVACAPRDLKRGVRVRRSLLLSVLAPLPLALWMLRNRSVSGTWSGERGPSSSGLAAELADLGATCADWLVPWLPAGEVRNVVALVAVVSIVLALRRWMRATQGDPVRAAFLAHTALAACYGGALVLMASYVHMDRLGERLLLPLLPLLHVAWIVALCATLEDRARVHSAVLTLLLGANLVHGALAVPELVARMRREGAGGFADARRTTSELARWLREHELEGAVYSNDPEFVLLAGDRLARPVGESPDGIALAAQSSAGGATWLVWESRGERSRRRLQELVARFELELEAELADGAVYLKR